eukprot:Awhi_evm1s14286
MTSLLMHHYIDVIITSSAQLRQRHMRAHVSLRCLTDNCKVVHICIDSRMLSGDEHFLGYVLKCAISDPALPR